MSTVSTRLREIQRDIGTVGTEKLYAEAKKRKVPGISKEAVRLYLSTDESKQLFKPLPDSKGKTAAEAEGFRLQVDLIDEKFNPSRIR